MLLSRRLNNSGLTISGVGETSSFDATTMKDQLIYAPSWPLLASAPATVVNNQSFRIPGGSPYGTELYGEGDVWVARASVTMGLYISDGLVWYRDLSQDICEIPIKATGTGTGVATVRITSSVDTVMQTCGSAKFYTDAAGTLDESQSVALSAGVDKLVYLRLSSGTCYLLVDKCASITKFGEIANPFFSEATNSPTINNFNTRYTQNATVIRFIGNLMTISGTTYAWTNATVIRFIGNLMTISGTTYAWTNATTVWFSGNLMTISGTAYAWTNAKTVWFSGNLMTISGTTYAWTNATTVWFSGNLMTISGTTYAWTNATVIWFDGSLMTVTYATKSWRATLDTLLLSIPSITTAMADQICIDIDASGTTAIGSKTINIAGLCAPVSSASLTARNSLVAKTFVVTVNT